VFGVCWVRRTGCSVSLFRCSKVARFAPAFNSEHGKPPPGPPTSAPRRHHHLDISLRQDVHHLPGQPNPVPTVGDHRPATTAAEPGIASNYGLKIPFRLRGASGDVGDRTRWPCRAGGDQRPLRRLSGCAGLPKILTPHSLRHSWVTHLTEDGVDRRFIQEAVGHRCDTSTAIYTRVSGDFMNTALRKALGPALAASALPRSTCS
jgi:Phage integrase family